MIVSALIAGFLSGIIGAMGLGGGAVLIIYLSIFTSTEQLTAQGINLLFFIPIGTLAVIIYSIRKQINWKTIMPLAFGGIIGSVSGIFIAKILGGNMTAKLFGTFLILLGLKELFFFKKANNK